MAVEITADQGERRGRYVLVRDVDGRRHALAAVCEDQEGGGCLLLLPGGRVVRLDTGLEVVLGWLT